MGVNILVKKICLAYMDMGGHAHIWWAAETANNRMVIAILCGLKENIIATEMSCA